MNERIKELAEEAEFYVVMFDENNVDNARIEKFAELIIRESIDIAFRRGDNVDYLKEHFGV